MHFNSALIEKEAVYLMLVPKKCAAVQEKMRVAASISVCMVRFVK